MRNRDAYSLIELVFVLTLGALAIAIAVAPVRHAHAVLSVRAARSELVALAAMTRSTAIMTGGATLMVDVAAGAAWIEQPSGERVGDVQHIAARHGVSLTASRGLLAIRYDALGIGRMAGGVIRVRRGTVTGTVTVSAYGRVRLS